MLRPYQLIAIFTQADQTQPGYRGGDEIKFTLQVFVGVSNNPGIQPIKAAPIHMKNRNISLFKHDLQWTCQPSLPEKARAQDRMSCDHGSPCFRQTLGLKTFHRDTELGHV